MEQALVGPVTLSLAMLSLAMLWLPMPGLAVPVARAQICENEGYVRGRACPLAERDATGCCPPPAEPARRAPPRSRGAPEGAWCERWDEGSDHSACLRFLEVERRLEAFEPTAIAVERVVTLDDYVTQVESECVRVEREAAELARGYDTVRSGRAVFFSLAADARAGRAHELAARAILNTPFVMPADLQRRIRDGSPEVREDVRVQVQDRIQQLLDGRVRPTECRAIARYARVVRTARTSGVADSEYAALALDRLQAYGPYRFEECLAGPDAAALGLAPYDSGEFDVPRRGPLSMASLLDLVSPWVMELPSEMRSSAGASAFEAGTRAVAARDWDAARRELETAFARDPTLVAARVDLALLDARAEALRPLALRSLEALVSSHPSDPSVVRAFAWLLHEVEGAGALRRLEARPVGSAWPALAERARILSMLERSPDALRALRNAGDGPAIVLARGRATLDSRDIRELVRARADLASASPSPELYVLRAAVASALGRYEEANVMLRGGAQQFPSSALAVAALALSRARSGHADECRRALDAFGPTIDVRVALVRAECTRWSERHPGSTAAELPVALGPHVPEPYLERALLRWQTAEAAPDGLLAALQRTQQDLARAHDLSVERRGASWRARVDTLMEEVLRQIEREQRRLEREAARRQRDAERARQGR